VLASDLGWGLPVRQLGVL